MAQGAQRVRFAVARDEARIVKSAHDAIVGMNQSGEITSCNPAAVRLYGYPAEQLIGRPVELLIPPERRAAEADVLRRILAGEEVHPYRTDRVCRSGAVIAVFVTISPIADATGAIVGAATMARRATLQDARERFEARVDRQRVDARDAADRFEVRVDQDRQETQDAADRFETRVVAERVQARDAEYRYQDQMDAQLAQAQGDQDLLRSQLRQGQRLEVLGRLADGAAHDLDDLLAAILDHAASVAEELAGGPESDLESAARDVARIQQTAERAAGLTHRLLAFGRRDGAQPRMLDLNHVITDVEELVRRTIGKEIVLHLQLAADLSPVLADPSQIEQVLTDLALDARGAMTGGGTLTIDTANITLDADEIRADPPVRPGRHVRLRVSDTGTGRSEDAFFATAPDSTGAGLGLATVSGIVARIDGSLTIQSRPGNGTTVTILIPATDEVAVPVPS
jgi:PAS domain S-box-containing protein